MTLERFIDISKKSPKTVKKWIKSGWVNGAFYIDGKYYISDLARPPYTRASTKSSESIRKGIVIACKRRLSINAIVLDIDGYEFDIYIDQLIASGLIEKRIVDNVSYYYATMKADNMSDNMVYTKMKQTSEEKKSESKNTNNNPRIFISYSWTDEDHKTLVLELAKRMRHDGVDVILDQWDLKPGHDKYVFMEQSINKADKVLIICDKQYAIKADDREGGVGTETAIITPNVYNNSDQSKFIPVIIDSFEIVPTYLKSRLGVDYRAGHREEGYMELLRIIYESPKNKKPELGKAPNWLNQSSHLDKKIDSTITHIDNNTVVLADVMLLYAAEYDGTIVVSKSWAGSTYLVGNKYNMNASQSPREIAKWDAAVEYLTKEGLIVCKEIKGEDNKYQVTNYGYAISDRFKDDNELDINKLPQDIIKEFAR